MSARALPAIRIFLMISEDIPYKILFIANLVFFRETIEFDAKISIFAI